MPNFEYSYTCCRRHQRKFKTDQQHSRFWTKYFGGTLRRPQWMVPDLRLTEIPSSTRTPLMASSKSWSGSRNSATIRWERRDSPKYSVQERECWWSVLNHLWCPSLVWDAVPPQHVGPPPFNVNLCSKFCICCYHVPAPRRIQRVSLPTR